MLILASGSPRRRELLEGLSLELKILPSDIDERIDEGLSPDDYVKTLSFKKAKSCPGSPEDYVIAADTVVYKDGRIYGKPKDRSDAFSMLKAFSDSVHQVYTGFTIAHMSRVYSESIRTDVYFRALSNSEIYDYIDREAPYDKAGAYGIQEGAGLFVQKIDGSYDNVVGLPLCALEEALLKNFGLSLSSFRKKEIH